MNNTKHILIISYLFEPNNSVGAKRASYWAKNINRLDSSITCDVISTTPNDTVVGVDNYFYISNPNKPKGLIKDEGITWKKELKNWLSTNTAHYDVVIMSGSPFMYFSIGKQFKKKGTKVIIDFRDPFAMNPRFANSSIKIRIKKYFEKKFIKHADVILSVNSYCLNLISNFKKSNNKYKTIRNGFEKSIVEKINILDKCNTVNFIYSGTFLPDRNPTFLLNLIRGKNNGLIHHVGRVNDKINHSHLKPYGLMDYKKMLNAIDNSDVGIIFCSGKPFESTTKIYDYIYREKPIWVISNEKITQGGIWDELKDYPSVVWTENNETAIENDLPKIKELIGKDIEIDLSKYSREYGLQQLISIINDLCK